MKKAMSKRVKKILNRETVIVTTKSLAHMVANAVCFTVLGEDCMYTEDGRKQYRSLYENVKSEFIVIA